MFEDLAYVAAIVLLPLIPALLLYKFLPPGPTEASGPFRGLDIKLSGSFAGYFLVVLIVTSFVIFKVQRGQCPQCPPPPPAYQYEVYTVTGMVDLQGGLPESLDHRKIKLSLEPPPESVLRDGSFSFRVPVERGQAGEPEFGTLLIEYDDREKDVAPVTVHLDKNNPHEQPFKVNYDNAAKKINITGKDSHLIKFEPPRRLQPNTVAQPINSPEGNNQ